MQEVDYYLLFAVELKGVVHCVRRFLSRKDIGFFGFNLNFVGWSIKNIIQERNFLFFELLSCLFLPTIAEKGFFLYCQVDQRDIYTFYCFNSINRKYLILISKMALTLILTLSKTFSFARTRQTNPARPNQPTQLQSRTATRMPSITFPNPIPAFGPKNSKSNSTQLKVI